MTIGQEKAIFLSALDYASPSEREAFLSRACGPDGDLRDAVEKLLRAHAQSLNVLDERPVPCDLMREQLAEMAPKVEVDATPALSAPKSQSVHDRTGESIGHYRLMEKIGEGGFGQVYVAEQQRPIRRRVALKLLKSFMDSKEVIARFEAERQALALMDHPNIAQVFDGGTSTTGQPYFVMELVRGVPITEFCEQQRPSIRERLALFIDVCHAVQHAHQRGVIHRDLKPSNVMVTLHDVTPVVKVIDFGVAKAIGEPLTDKTIYTRFAQMIGTPMYMSPEQAELNSLDVDTRSDVYALGVLLYELLTGTTPYDQKRMQTATFDELRRIIREEEPPRPSTRLSTRIAADQSTHAGKRGPVPDVTMARTLRGELDWVVMKAMEKDRRRRYESAVDLARDVKRYLDQQPVVARPPSPFYRLQKFAQRNLVAFTATSLVLFALVSGTAVSTWQAIRATNALATAEKHRKNAEEFANRLKEANVLLDSARANADQQQWHPAWSEYTRATELQPEHYLTWSGRGSLGVRLGAWKTAAGDFGKALRLGAPANNPGWWGVPQLCAYSGDSEAYELARDALTKQFDSSDNAVFLVFAARGILDRPMKSSEAVQIAQRLEKQLEQHLRDDRPPRKPRPGEPGFKGKGPGPFGEKRPGPPPKEGHPPEPRGPFGPGAPGEGSHIFGMGPPGVPPEIAAYTIALAHYRAGAYGAAEKELRKILERDAHFPASRMALPVLAMTSHALGNKEESEQYLAKTDEFVEEWIAQWSNYLDDGNTEKLPGPWFDLIELLLLRREAHEKIRNATPLPDSRLDEIEKRALTRFQNS